MIETFSKISEAVYIPNPFKKYSLTGPIPGIFLIDLDFINSIIFSASFGRINCPFGFFYSEANFARTLFAPTPQLTVNPVF